MSQPIVNPSPIQDEHRCPSCNYDLSIHIANTADDKEQLTCPECGKAYTLNELHRENDAKQCARDALRALFVAPYWLLCLICIATLATTDIPYFLIMLGAVMLILPSFAYIFQKSRSLTTRTSGFAGFVEQIIAMFMLLLANCMLVFFTGMALIVVSRIL